MQKVPAWKVAPLLMATGLSGLTYQVVWLRQLRVVFGASTAATGMVLAVFMGGLGIGAVLLGRFADRSRNPLNLYGRLELGIAASAVLSPLLILLVRKFYIYLGGTMTLGLPLATVVRVVLSFLVLGVPTLLMGGTLPAAIRSVETTEDLGRRELALLYGINTFGGVLGVCMATFVMLELLGNRTTLLSASLLNFLAGLVALWLARHITSQSVTPGNKVGTTDSNETTSAAPVASIYVAALICGFAFLLMELVWYRMLAPLLGGSIYTFGLILAVALAGIGIGGTLYSTRDRASRSTITAFAVICGLEALFMAVPYGLGDRLAILTFFLKPFDILGFSSQLVCWTLVTSIVVLLPAIMSGIQFPMLIGLLGQGSKDIGRHTGYVYGWNTGGAILGSLAGGFGFIPLLSAPGCWELAVILLALLSFGAILLAVRLERPRLIHLASAAIIAGAAVVLLAATGPTETWRHRTIGVGNSTELVGMSRNELYDWQNEYPRTIIWEKDGIESSVALKAYSGLSFIVNGKSDGHVLQDAGTQIMGPLVGAILHPEPKKAMVIGLGTGSSSGWLAEVPTIEHVDTVELESVILEVAKKSAPVNFNVVSHPKVRMIIGDAREIVQTIDQQYDVIFSEPSNPYRAGIASLYTREFYESIARCLAPKGIFSQWVQSYHVDQQTIRTLSATLASVFGNVEIWLTNAGDMLFVCSMDKIQYSVPSLKQRLVKEPFSSALRNAWGVSGLEGFLAGYVGRAEVPHGFMEEETKKGMINSDDRMLVEFGFARTAGRKKLFSLAEMRRVIRERNLHRPDVVGGVVDWNLVDENFFRMMLWINSEFVINEDGFLPSQKQQAAVFKAFGQGDIDSVFRAWQAGIWKTVTPLEKVVLAEAMAEKADQRAIELLEEDRGFWPATADAIMARLYYRRGENEKAFNYLSDALKGFRDQPWQVEPIILHAINLAIEMGYAKYRAKELFALLEEPFSVYNFEEYRKFALAMVGKNIDYQYGAKALSQLEPHIPWKEPILRYRVECYAALGHPLAALAKRDLQLFLKNSTRPFTL